MARRSIESLVDSCNVLSWVDLVFSLEINEYACSVEDYYQDRQSAQIATFLVCMGFLHSYSGLRCLRTAYKSG